MKKILITLLLSTVLLANGIAQEISANNYNKAIIHEDFNTEGNFFPIITTADNYFILDKGDYLLSRNNEESEYAIIANNSSVNNFILKTSVRIGPSNNKKASVGIIIKAQPDGKGAIIFEVNKKREYRIKQLLGSTYKTLSGNSKQEGWVKDKTINGVDEHNFIEIRTKNNIYDVYVNSNYIATFFIPDYTSGSCGLIISPETKARIAYYYIHTEGENKQNEQSITAYSNVNTTNSNAAIEELNKKIETLTKDNATLRELNTKVAEEQAEQKNTLTKKNIELTSVTNEQEKEIASLQRRITDLKSDNSKIKELEKTISENTTLISELNTKKTTLTKDVAALTKEATLLNAKNTKQAKENTQQAKEITKLTASATELASVGIEQEKEIKKLSTTLANLKSQNSKITNDLNIANKSSKNKLAQLTTEISSLQSSKKTLTADLTKEKNAHLQIKKELSKSVKDKEANIKTLTGELNNANQLLESANKTSANLKKCVANYATLSSELKQTNNELTTLKTTQAQHNKVTTDLNANITTLKGKIKVLNNQLSEADAKLTALDNKNTELRELFFLKDFEINGVKPSELTKQTNTYPTPKEIKGSRKIYAVQFGVYMQAQSHSALQGLEEIWYETTEEGTYVYLSGQFKSPQKATAHKNSLIALGYPNAFVVTRTK